MRPVRAALWRLVISLSPSAIAAATIRSFSARDQCRRRCTDAITSTCALVIGLALGDAEPGAVASEVARASGIHSSQLFRWRQQLCERAQIPAVFNPVTVTPEAQDTSAPSPERTGSSSPGTPGVIEIEFAAGGRMRISGPVDASTLSALTKVLAKGNRRR